MLPIIAALESNDPRERPAEKTREADAAHARWKDAESDFIGILPEEGGAVEISGIGAEVFPAGTELPPSASLTGSTTGTATTAAP